MRLTFAEELDARVEATPADVSLEGASVKASPFTLIDLRKEKGHDDLFLDPAVPTPLPGLSASNDLSAQEQGLIKRLDYRHFSVLFDLRRKQALCTIVDIDGRNWTRVRRRNPDVWYPDPRVSDLDQPQKKHFAKPDPRFDAVKNHFAFGHLVRRLDPCWGAEATEIAERQTFFLANASPQAEELNSLTWNDLEDLVLDDLVQRLRIRACVLTGPIFGDANRPRLHGDMPVPTQYFKIAAWRSEGRLAAVAWVQDQPADVLPPPQIEAILPFEEPGADGRRKPSLMWLRPIEEIARATGLDLSAYAAGDTYALRKPGAGLESVFAVAAPRIANADDLLATSALPLDDRDEADPAIRAARALLSEREPAAQQGAFVAETVAEAGAGATAAENAAAAARVSERAFKLIVDYETGGREFYEKHYRKRAVWPKGASGVTIGFGYDLGYVTAAEFEHDWAALPAGDRSILAKTIGMNGGNRSAAQMQAALASVKSVIVEWELAGAVFKARTLPKFAGMTWRALQNCNLLSGDCFGALVSLAFNRGASFSMTPKPGHADRWVQMRAIRQHMASKNFAAIPQEFLNMIPLWKGTEIETGMRRRRTDEARLFRDGLSAAPEAAPAPGLVAEAAFPDHSLQEESELFGDETEAEAIGAAESALLLEAVQSVAWASDDNSPDYAHLGALAAPGSVFTLAPADIEWLARLNDFDLEGDQPILFGLRGAVIVTDHESAGGVSLKDVRPDHQTTRCTLGVWDPRAATIAVFPGSTVPNARAVSRWRERRDMGNILATGAYGYITGVHNGKPGCFLLRERVDRPRRVVVRRSDDNLSYELRDRFDPCAPGDNIHPTFFSSMSGFSSVGCQTIVGVATPEGKHSGPWAKFRAAARYPKENGRPYRYFLLTGAEARLASRARRDGLTADLSAQRNLRRLRFGSTGEAVARLQKRLGVTGADGDFGPATAARLHEFQRGLSGANGSDAIYTPTLDATLGWGVFDGAVA